MALFQHTNNRLINNNVVQEFDYLFCTDCDLHLHGYYSTEYIFSAAKFYLNMHKDLREKEAEMQQKQDQADFKNIKCIEIFGVFDRHNERK